MKAAPLLFLTAALAMAQSDTIQPVVDSEIARLEAVKVKRALFDEERIDLASLHFLRGECHKVRAAYADNRQPLVPLDERDSDLLCACDGRCDMMRLTEKSRFQHKFAAFRGLLASGQGLSDPQVASLWNQLQERPEARYALYQALKKSPKADDRRRAAALWKELATLNVAAP
jgi:hypothetical protein